MGSYKVLLSKPSCVIVNNYFIDERIDSNYYRSQSLKDLKTIIDNSEIDNISSYFDVSKLAGFEYTSYFTQENLAKGSIVALTSQNVLENGIDFSNVMKIPIDIHNTLNRSKILSGDILLSYTGQYRRACVVPENLDLHLGPNICRLRKKKTIDEHYVSTFLNSKYGQSILDREKTVSAQPTVNMSRIRSITIPILSPEIQKYIGDKVRRAEEVREEAKKLKEEVDKDLEYLLELSQLKEKLRTNKSKFTWIITEKIDSRMDGEYYKTNFIVNNDHIESLKHKGIEVIKLYDIIDEGSYGILPSSNDYGVGEVRLLRSTNLKEFLIDYSDSIKVPENYYKEKVQVKKGDILLEIKGQCYAGAIVETLEDKMIVNGSVYKFSVKEEFNNYYVLAYLLSESGQLQKQQNLANNIISYLSLDCIKNLNIPIVSKEKQDDIGSKYRMYVVYIEMSKQLIQEAKQDVEDLIEGNFDMSKLNEHTTESR